MKILNLILIVLTLSAFSHMAVAQDDPTIKPLPEFLGTPSLDTEILDRKAPQAVPDPDMAAPEEEVKKSDLSDIPDEFIVEASNFGVSCRNNVEMTLYFDCRCLGIKYLDARIELGKEASASAIQNQLGKECKDGTGIAGQVYEKCLTDFFNAPKHLDPEEYCSCYGKTFAKYFEQFPGSLNPRAKIALMSKAQLTCQDPVAARRIYGTR